MALSLRRASRARFLSSALPSLSSHSSASQSLHKAFSRRTLATLPPANTPTGSIIIRPAPNTAVGAPILVPPPVPGSGPLLERRADRQLPPYTPWWAIWAKTLPLFVTALTLAALGIFNYQKLSSSTVAAVLYALRTNARVREELGGEIYFRDRVPWVWGELNQVRGRIDIGFGVKGKRGRGYVVFRAFRRRGGFFITEAWDLTMEDGRVLRLLEDGDPLGGSVAAVPDEGDARLIGTA